MAMSAACDPDGIYRACAAGRGRTRVTHAPLGAEPSSSEDRERIHVRSYHRILATRRMRPSLLVKM